MNKERKIRFNYKKVISDFYDKKQPDIIENSIYEGNNSDFYGEKDCCESSESDYNYEKIVENFLVSQITEEFVENNADFFDFRILLRLPTFPESFSKNFIKKFSSEIAWEDIPGFYRFKNNFIIEYKDKFNFDNSESLLHRSYSEEELRQLEPNIKFLTSYVNRNSSRLSKEFIYEFKHKIDFSSFYNWEIVSIKLLREIKDIIDWDVISDCYKITEEFLDSFKNYINWNIILRRYTFSERIFEKFSKEISQYFSKSHKQKFNSMIENSLKEEEESKKGDFVLKKDW